MKRRKLVEEAIVTDVLLVAFANEKKRLRTKDVGSSWDMFENKKATASIDDGGGTNSKSDGSGRGAAYDVVA